MPLEEIVNLANVSRKPSLSDTLKIAGVLESEENDKCAPNMQPSVIKVRSRSQTGSPKEVRLKAWKLDTSSEAPKLTLDEVNSPLNMAQVNGLFKEQTSPGRERPPTRLASSPIVRNALFSSETAVDPQAWSAAVGPATTGRSGRMIERLQGEIDRLNRDKKLLKARYEDAEKAHETLASQNRYLTDRNTNYEQSHEANQRQLARKDRQLEELREELKKEKLKTERAHETARAATASEETWRVEANVAKSISSQKEAEYEAIMACRNRDNDRHQGGLDKMKNDFTTLLRQREEDLEKYRKLEVIAEQQRQTINQLERLTRELRDNFKAYRTEIDTAILEMRGHVTSNDTAVSKKLEEMQAVTGQMRWVMNMEEINRGPQDSTKVNDEVDVTPTTPSRGEKRGSHKPLSPSKPRKGKR